MVESVIISSPDTECGSQEQVRAFNPQFDYDAVVEILPLRTSDPIKYQQELDRRLSCTETNWQRYLAERYGLAVHRFSYDITPNGLEHQQLGNMLQGMQHATEEMRPSQPAVVVAQNEAWCNSFAQAQAALINPAAPDNLVVVLPSPKGPVYKENFFDVLIKRGKTVEATRFLSSLPVEVMGQRCNELSGKLLFPPNAGHLDLKQRAVICDPAEGNEQTEDTIKQTLGGGVARISDDQFYNYVIPTANDDIRNYLLAMRKVPPVVRELQRQFNITVGKADDIAFGTQPSWLSNTFKTAETIPLWQIDAYYANKYVREIASACGYGGGFDLNDRGGGFGFAAPRIFDIFDLYAEDQQAPAEKDEGFGIDNKGSRKIYCCECKKTYQRPLDKTIPFCILTRNGKICGNKKGIAC